MTDASTLDVMMVGHFAKDRLVVDGRAEMSRGGAVYYGAIALARLGLRVAVVTRLHPEDFSLLDELRDEAVQVFVHPAPATSGIENIYHSDDMERRITIPLGFAGPIPLRDIPNVPVRVYMAAGIIAGEVSVETLRALAGRGPVALDVQGFVRVREGNALVFKRWPEITEGLRSVTYLKADLAEAELLTGEQNLASAARRLAAHGPQEIVLTESAGVTVWAGGQIYHVPFDSRSLAGRTGRGDTCFSTYVGMRLSATPAEASRIAAWVTSRKQEQPGPWRGSLDQMEASEVA